MVRFAQNLADRHNSRVRPEILVEDQGFGLTALTEIQIAALLAGYSASLAPLRAP
jgi:hypothetical protein